MSDTSQRDDLKFFGQVSATISHDLKNVLAVINEGAGLLDDLCMLAGKGRPIEPERLASVAKSILGQVRRGDAIIKNMNTFAHSVDEDVRSMDMGEMLTLMGELCSRPVKAAGASLEVTPCECHLRADPYGVERVLHGMILCALKNAQQGTALTLSATMEAEGLRILLAGLPQEPHPEEQLHETARALGAQFHVRNRSLELTLPTQPPETGN